MELPGIAIDSVELHEMVWNVMELRESVKVHGIVGNFMELHETQFEFYPP